MVSERSEFGMQCGDRDTKYFHTRAIIKRDGVRIDGLKGADGEWCFDDQLLKQRVVEDFPGSSQCWKWIGYPNWTLPVELEEERRALWDRYPFKASSPDGFHAHTNQANRDAVGAQVLNLVCSIVDGEVSAGVINCTLYGQSVSAMCRTRLSRNLLQTG